MVAIQRTGHVKVTGAWRRRDWIGCVSTCMASRGVEITVVSGGGARPAFEWLRSLERTEGKDGE